MEISREYGGRTNTIHLKKIQNSFLIQHVLEPTRGDNVLHTLLASQSELENNVKKNETLCNTDHNQIHFDIKIKSESKNIIFFP